jgi:hypothetical protein
MILMVVVILTGAVQKGRIQTIRLHHVFRQHWSMGSRSWDRRMGLSGWLSF